MAALAVRAAPNLQERLNDGCRILVDAICNVEESDFYRNKFGNNLVVVAIDAPFAARAQRLAIRPLRPMTAEQLRERDIYEIETLRLRQVAEKADITIQNVDGIDQFEDKLRLLAKQRLCC